MKKAMPETEISRLFWRAFDMGESLMPCDVAKIIGKCRLKKYGIEECSRVLVDVMERCNFYCDSAEATEALK